MQYELNNLEGARLNKKIIDAVLKAFAKVFRGLQTYQVSIAIVSEAEIKRLNKIYRGKNKVTDILSFTYDNELDEFSEMNFNSLPAADKKQNLNLGEIIICFEQLKRQAEQYGQSQSAELRKLLIHGLVHLAGYDHEQDKEAEQMQDMEDKVAFQIK